MNVKVEAAYDGYYWETGANGWESRGFANTRGGAVRAARRAYNRICALPERPVSDELAELQDQIYTIRTEERLDLINRLQGLEQRVRALEETAPRDGYSDERNR